MTPEERARSVRCPTHGPHDHDLCVAAAIREAENAALERAAQRIMPKSRMIDTVEATVAMNHVNAIRGLKSSAAPG